MLTLPPRLDPVKEAFGRIRTADPFLMAAAIAYNAFFALVPLAFAGVAALSIVGTGTDRIDRIEEVFSDGFPEEIADFVVRIVNDAEEAVGSMGTVVIVTSMLIALWSGSRAVYAVQKALRMIGGVEDRRPYWVTRSLGIVFTIGAGIALIVGYAIVIFGDWLQHTLSGFGLHVGSVTGITSGVLVAWVVIVLFTIYRWGTPHPFRRSLASAVVTAVLLGLGTWLAAVIIPTFGTGSIAALGSVGVILVWSYVVGLIVIVTPALVPSIEDAIRGRTA